MKPWNQEDALAIIANARAAGDVLTGAMRKLADQFGYIDEAAIAPLARTFSCSKAEVHGVLHYYADFRTRAPGKHVLRLCQAESCQAVGARKAMAAAKDTHTDPAQVTLEPVYCLGLCANGPAAELDGRPLAYMDADMVRELLAEIA